MTKTVKFLLRYVLFKKLEQRLLGETIDPGDSAPIHFTKGSVNSLFDLTISNIESLCSKLDFSAYETVGNRLMVFFTVCSISCYKALIEFGIPKDRASELFSEIGWEVYRSLTKPYIYAAKLRHRHPQRQLNFFIKLLCRFPFSKDKNGYQYEVWKESNRICTNWYQCAAHNYVRTLNSPEYLEVFKSSWCKYDFSLPQLLNPKGTYERPHTLSHGDDVCDMKWYSGFSE